MIDFPQVFYFRFRHFRSSRICAIRLNTLKPSSRFWSNGHGQETGSTIVSRLFDLRSAWQGCRYFPLAAQLCDELQHQGARAVTLLRYASQTIRLVKADVRRPEQLPCQVLSPPTRGMPHIVRLPWERFSDWRKTKCQVPCRARIDEAYAGKEAADKAWLPQVSFGTAWFRHEGGIANQDGTLQNSSFGSLLAAEICGQAGCER